MGVRVWGLADSRLVEVHASPGTPFIHGLPPERVRTTRDRIRAALINTGLVRELPRVTVRLAPSTSGTTHELDLAIALAILVEAGIAGSGLRWIFATGRLGPDGRVFSTFLEEPGSSVTVVTVLERGLA
jgi:magnesium chelatase family protein